MKNGCVLFTGLSFRQLVFLFQATLRLTSPTIDGSLKKKKKLKTTRVTRWISSRGSSPVQTVKPNPVFWHIQIGIKFLGDQGQLDSSRVCDERFPVGALTPLINLPQFSERRLEKIRVFFHARCDLQWIRYTV